MCCYAPAGPMDSFPSSVPGVRPALERFTLARPPGEAVTREKRWVAVAAAYGLAGIVPLLAAVPALIVIGPAFSGEDLNWREGGALLFIAVGLAAVTALAILPAAAFLSGAKRWGWTGGALATAVSVAGAAMAFGTRWWTP